MATRNRTLIFRRYRDALKSVRAPASSPMASTSSGGGGGGPVIELVNASLLHPNRSYTPLSTEDPGNSSKGALTVGLPPAWVDVSEEIAANVQRARTKMAELAKAHAKALMPSFGDGKEDQHLIEALTQEITTLIKRSEKKLRRLSAAGPSEDSNVRKNVQRVVSCFVSYAGNAGGQLFLDSGINQHPAYGMCNQYELLSSQIGAILVNYAYVFTFLLQRSLATDLQSLSMELRKKQSTYLKRLRQQKEVQNKISSSSREKLLDYCDFAINKLHNSLPPFLAPGSVLCHVWFQYLE
uniref:Syntaxin N-terminal domain-containing protein n=1 Tax=Fagus sylvatica TaxID=28930 RepID=A0A2N9IWA6_FAGSY